MLPGNVFLKNREKLNLLKSKMYMMKNFEIPLYTNYCTKN